MRTLERRSPDCIHLAAAIYLCKQVRASIASGALKGYLVAPRVFPGWSVVWKTEGPEHHLTFSVAHSGKLTRAALREAIDHIGRFLGARVELEEARDAYIIRATTLYVVQEVA